MAITNGYTTLVRVKPLVGVQSANTDQDERLEVLIEATSRAIDRYCKRSFFHDAAAISFYTCGNPWTVAIADMSAVTEVVTDETGNGTYGKSWTEGTHYVLAPYNAALLGEPYTHIEVNPNGSHRLPVGIVRGLRVTGDRGWGESTPSIVRAACEQQVIRLHMRAKSPLGLSAQDPLGQDVTAVMLDPEIKMLLRQYVRAGGRGLI